MRIAILTSSRADYGIYLPLLKALEADKSFQLELIVFGTHLSRFHGYTVQHIEKEGFSIIEKVETLILGDTKEAIANAMGNTMIKFSSIWKKLEKNIDLVFALGDRYEMFAAVAASVPFNIEIAHIHGGETTLGAIDNTFRHAITLMSSLHFVATKEYGEKVMNLINSPRNIHNVGALSLDNLTTLKLLSKEAFKEKYSIDVSTPTILITFHPETVSSEENEKYANILAKTFINLSKDFQLVITMPNADTMGSLIREAFNKLIGENYPIIRIENFGTLGYFSCIKHCSFLLGNTSSGIIEAASFNKYVINLGNRQEGRAQSKNIIDTNIEQSAILTAVSKLKESDLNYNDGNIYHLKNSAKAIIKVLKERNF
jgi:GDP/UDP-N,N'-diacetylbacillosamine 2-epimerase (hydrolysing)